MNNLLFLRKINSKALFIVPHQDDEINIGSGMIPLLIRNGIDVYVVFATNGDYSTKGTTRIKECYNSLNKLGVKKENIIIMGYSDQHKRESTHIYYTENDAKWISKKGFSQTYHPLGKKEWCFLKEKTHKNFNRKNFINDIINIINDIKADYIYTIDFDSHPDHRALSLCVECALGKIFNNNRDYRPQVYKSFAYPTCYFGVKDFDSINIKSTNFNTEKYSYCDMQNPYYSWDERIRFPVLYSSITKNVFQNKTLKAMKCHKSQLLINEASSTINGDQIFWQRRTDNLMIGANIKVSSGDKDKLCDFMLFDCYDIMNGNTKKPVLESNAWIPDKSDEKPKIMVNFEENKIINEIKFYHAIETNGHFTDIEIVFDDNIRKKYELIPKKNNVSVLNINDIKTKKIEISILKQNGKVAGFSEIEILENKKKDNQFIKFEIDNDLAYKYYYNDELFKIYYYDGNKSRYLSKDEYRIECDNAEIYNDRLVLKKRKTKINIKCLLNENLHDEVDIYKINNLDIIKNKTINIINNLYIKCCYTYQRIVRKLKIYLKIN